MLGRLFSFIHSDVTEKIGIMEDYQAGSEKERFQSVKSMIEYELSIKRTSTTKPASGCRTLLRLHR